MPLCPMLRLLRTAALLILMAATAIAPRPAASQEPADPASSVPPAAAPATPEETAAQALKDMIAKHRGRTWESLIPPLTAVKSVAIDPSSGALTVDFNWNLTYQPLREDRIRQLTALAREALDAAGFSGKPITLTAEGRDLADYVPASLRESWQWPAKPAPPLRQQPWVRRADPAAPAPANGLYGRTIGVWHSHGLYWDENAERWSWQRPRMFTLVEDKLPQSFILPWLVPMLERAGAYVALPRERSWQVNEVIVDNADEGGASPFSTRGEGWETGPGAGFRNGLSPLEPGVIPHRMGGHLVIATAANATAAATWIPNIPADGLYPVYITYNAAPDRTDAAHYAVHHTGGVTHLRVNQQAGGNVWVFAGDFYFRAGANPEIGKVELLNDSPQPGSTISADAVRFGGGMDDVLRGGTLSGYPRFNMGSETYLQYMGYVDDYIYSPRWNNYTRDYGGRGEFVNYISGPPNSSNITRDFPGLGVPVDLSLAFHTDAGITSGVVGSLAIYRVQDEAGFTTFPDMRSRWLNRDFSDLVQTQIVDDVRATFSTTWVRRQLREASYGESRRPNMPALLLELLSHQDFDDAKYALDPRFRFVVARAIYKGMLRFLAQEHGFEPVVAPLAPAHLSVKGTAPGTIEITWRATPDPLEPSAAAEGFAVYMRRGDTGGFDNGRYVTEPRCVIMGLDPGALYSFQVTAVNRGGESLPSETLAARTGSGGEKKALIVNGFDRLAPPAFIEAPGHKGVARHLDKGVPYLVNLSLTGDMYEFDPAIEFLNNDYPGHGASYADMENVIELGNTFDYTARHGAAIADAGWAFDSASDETIAAAPGALAGYDMADWLLGEERATPPYAWGDPATTGYPDKMTVEFKTLEPAHQKAIADYLAGGGKLLITGAYVASDLGWGPHATAADKEFLGKTLLARFNTNFGSRTNNAVPAPAGDSGFAPPPALRFSAGAGEDGVYGVEAPDSLLPAARSKAVEVLRYADGAFCAGIAAREPHRVIVLGFPFEAIVGADSRAAVMKWALEF